MTVITPSLYTARRRTLVTVILPFLIFSLVLVSGCDGRGGASETAYLERAQQRMQAGEYSAAVIEYRNALRLEARPETRAALGRAQLEAGQYVDAADHLGRAFRQTGSDDLILPLTRALFKLDRLPEILELPVTGELEPRASAEFQSYRALAHVEAGQPDFAREALARARESGGDRALIQLAEARIAFVEGDVEGARVALGGALDADDALAPAWTLLGDLARREGDREAALDAYDRALQLRPNQIAERIKRALTLVELERYDAAAEDGQFLREGAPGHPGGHFLLGLVHFQQERLEDARPYFEDALSRYRDFRPAMPYLAAIHLKQGQLNQARQLLQRHAWLGDETVMTYRLWTHLDMEQDDPTAARSRLERALERHPQLTPALGDMLAAIYLDLGEHGRGVDFLRTSLDEGQGSGTMQALLARVSEGESPSEGAAETLGEHRQSVGEALRASNYAQALERADALLEAYPDDSELYNLKGGAHLALGELGEAMQAFRDALQHDAGNVGAVRNLGQLLERGGREDMALQLYRQAHERNPDNLEVILSLARLEAREGNDARAGSLVDHAIEHHPQEPRPRMLKARHALLSGDPATALSVLDPVVIAQTDNAGFMRLLGEARLGAGEADGAVEALKQAQEAGAGGLELKLMLARAMVEAGRADEAEAVIRRAITDDPNAVQPRLLLVRLLGATGDHAGAEEVYQDLLELTDREPAVLREGAHAALRAGKTEEAVSRLREAWFSEPSDGLARELAHAHIRNQDPDAAQEVLENWLSGQPGEQVSSATLHFLAQVRKEVAPEDANPLYEQLIDRNPDDVVALNNLAWNLRETHPHRASTLAKRALDAAPDSSAIRHTLAMTLAAKGEVSDAITHLERAIDGQDEASADFQMDLAELYARAGRFGDARGLLERLAADEDFERMEEAHEALERLP